MKNRNTNEWSFYLKGSIKASAPPIENPYNDLLFKPPEMGASTHLKLIRKQRSPLDLNPQILESAERALLSRVLTFNFLQSVTNNHYGRCFVHSLIARNQPLLWRFGYITRWSGFVVGVCIHDSLKSRSWDPERNCDCLIINCVLRKRAPFSVNGER